jgi:fructose-1,6-bisphosphatase/sedoheptulose 1,7-bisphosphatase-like protein
MPRTDEEKSLVAEGVPAVYGLADLAPAGDVDVAVTGVSGGPLLPGVTLGSGFAETSSLLMSSRHGTVRHLTTRHGATGLAVSR